MASQPNRKLLTKLLRSPDVRKEHRDLLNERTASRFVQGVCEDEDPMDILFQLNRRDQHLVRTLFTLGSSNSFMDQVVMPFLGWLGKDALSIGTCSKRQQSICNELARAPGLLDGLLEALNCDEISDELALVWFLERLILDEGTDGADARVSGAHRALAKRLTRSLSPQVEIHAQKLFNILQDPEEMSKRCAEVASTGALAGGGISLESIQESHAGGRHSNDHADFRSITIVPSVDEVLCEKMSFLPTSRCPNTSHLDRQFRLLRHDMVATVIDAVRSLKPQGTTTTTSANGRDRSKKQGAGGGRGGGGGGGRPPFVLRNAKRGAIIADNAGRTAAMLVHFDWPGDHGISRMKPHKQWEYLQQASGPGRGGGSSRKAGGGHNLLKRDSLVVLTDKSLKPLLLANITLRDEVMMVWGQIPGGGAGSWRDRQESRPAVGVSFHNSRDLEAALLLSRDDGWGCLVPLSVGVFAYEPVLKKMQIMVDVPMADLLVDWPDQQLLPESTTTAAAEVEREIEGESPPPPTAAGALPILPPPPPPPLYDHETASVIERLAERFAPSPSDLEKQVPLVLSPPLPQVVLPNGCQFDISQRVAVAQVLRQRISLVHGPPGTGKSFIGEVIVQVILSLTSEKVLVICYTNHALDSVLEALVSKGVNSLVRIGGGSKSTKLDPYQLRNRPDSKFTTVQSRQYGHLKGMLETSQEAIDAAQHRLNRKPTCGEMLEWLEDEDPAAFGEFEMPEVVVGLGGSTVVGRNGRALTREAIFKTWLDGKSKPSALNSNPNPNTTAETRARRGEEPHPHNQQQQQQSALSGIWGWNRELRKAAWDAWEIDLKKEVAEHVARKVENHNMQAEELAQLQLQRNLSRMRGARVVGCTTTGAAMHHALLSEAGCGMVLVEEAAEVLEAHVLTALEPSTKHLIMIGDHKQLRPKVEQYSLRVESGRGFDLNVSLFERLVNKGYPHTTLELQHRMPPEISALVRGLTYPGLRDGPGTLGRPGVRGVRDRVCFVAHNHKEDTAASMRQRQQDDGGTASKVNLYEVGMVVKTVRYLLLQGYKPDQIVVLTPYLAQLKELRDALDGTISDRDASDLAVAIKQGGGGGGDGSSGGSSSGGKQGKKKNGSGKSEGDNTRGSGGHASSGPDSRQKVRVSTVDNYQGEENDLVIGSFVRSNDGGQMGFVGDANRLNVAISRARLGMILFGDMDFFTSDSVRNKSGQRLWLKFMSLLEAGGHVYRDGLPAVCETHKTRVDLSSPEAFDQNVPDGGCRVMCGATLACDGGHPCPRRCHPGDDQAHKNADCGVTVVDVCRKGHTSKRRCTKDPAGFPCKPCEREADAIAREVARLAESERQRELEREAASARLAEARRNAVLERERLTHEMGLLRMERETQREELDAERTRTSQQGAHAELGHNRAAASKRGVNATGGGGGGRDSGGGGKASSGVADSTGSAVSSSRQPTGILKGKDKKSGKARGDEVKTASAGDNSNSINATSTKGEGSQRDEKGGVMCMKGSSTLLLIATAAAAGNAGGIIDALKAIPPSDLDKTSHELAVALGDAAYQWFPPSSGGEPVLARPPAARTAQALGLMGKGEWVKARATLAAALKDTAEDSHQTSSTSSKRDPSAVYALALCDHHLGGGAEAARQLSELAAAERGFWPGPPDGHLPPDARAFPLAALVHAHLEASTPPSTDPPSTAPSRAGARAGTGDGNGAGAGAGAGEDTLDEGNAGDDPKLRACLLGVSFLRAPAHNRKAGKVDSVGWTEAAEAVVRSTGAALSRALWGPDAATDNDSDGLNENHGGGGGKGAGDNKVRAQWRALQSKWGVSSRAMDDLLNMSGLDVIKADFLSVVKLAVIDRERGFDLSARSFNVRLEGNPGTGKTTVGRLYYRLLKDIGVFASAERRAQDLQDAANAAARKKAADNEKLRVKNERKAFQAAGLPYNNPPPATAGGASSTATTAVGTLAANSGSAAGAGAATSKEEGFVETTGAALADCGTKGLEGMLAKIKSAGGGVLFVDEAYTLEPQGTAGGQGKQVLNFLLAEIENRRGELVVAFAGYAKNMETLFEFNEGLPSRFPKTFKFEDYSDELLLEIFLGLMERNQGLETLRLAPGAGEGARWAKVAIARLGRKRSMRGFGNARAVRALFDKVMQRQADRLSSGGEAADDADPYELVKSDLLGVSISSLEDSADWRKLRDMIGLASVKEAVHALAELVKTNLVLEEAGKPPRGVALNRCMIGNPGTGKTTVAKLYAGILTDLGLLSKGEVVLKTASDFVGSVIGESETKTRAILKASEGCVLVIDEAYSLGPGSTSSTDPYRLAVVDTLVEQVQNVPGEDRCVLLLGYRAEMEEFMRKTNPGLARRFAMDNAFLFEDYTDEDLLAILRGKLKSEELMAGVESLMAAAAVLRQRRLTASHFGNGGEVANLLSEAKLRKEKRRGDGSIASRLDPEIVPRDFDPGYGDAPPDSATLEDDLFGDLIGCDAIKIQLRRIRSTFVHAEKVGRDPRETLNLNFRFTGAPGTGKTTIAQRLGRMFKQLGLLRSDEVVSCSPSDFTTGYVGQAAIKTKEMMDKAIGKVLFVDEAYGLNPHQTGSHGATFMQEAVDQLVQCLTDDKYKGNMVVVVAGYARDIDGLMQANPGLASRFPETLHFPSFDVQDSSRLLETGLKKGFNTDLAPDAVAALPGLLQPLVQAPRFGNGRTITDLAKRIFTEIGMRMGDGGDGGIDRQTSGRRSDPRASVDDVRRSVDAVLAQMAEGGAGETPTAQGANGGGGSGSASPVASFGASSEAPKTTSVTATTTTATSTSCPAEMTCEEIFTGAGEGKEGGEEWSDPSNPFLDDKDRRTLQRACEIAGIPDDSPKLSQDVEDNEDLRRALLLPSSNGGVGLSAEQAEAFLQRVGTDRAAMSHLEREALDAAAKRVSDEADAKRAVEEAGAEIDEAESSVGFDDDLLALLRLAKRAKEEALRKLEEKRRVELAKEAATQTAIRRMGVCVAGYQWHRTRSGWRCAGGTHFLSENAVAAEIARGSSS